MKTLISKIAPKCNEGGTIAMINQRLSTLLALAVMLLVTATFVLSSRAATSIETFTTAGSTAWVCPVGVSSVTVECWGGGGSGGSATMGATSGNSGGGGGGGGAYARNTVSGLTAGTTYTVVVGAGGLVNTSSGVPNKYGPASRFMEKPASTA